MYHLLIDGKPVCELGYAAQLWALLYCGYRTKHEAQRARQRAIYMLGPETVVIAPGECPCPKKTKEAA